MFLNERSFAQSNIRQCVVSVIFLPPIGLICCYLSKHHLLKINAGNCWWSSEEFVIKQGLPKGLHFVSLPNIDYPVETDHQWPQRYAFYDPREPQDGTL